MRNRIFQCMINNFLFECTLSLISVRFNSKITLIYKLQNIIFMTRQNVLQHSFFNDIRVQGD